MFIRKKRNSSGSVSIQILKKVNRRNILIKTVGSSKDKNEIELLYEEALKLIPELTNQPIFLTSALSHKINILKSRIP